jgi:hypothetical protein
MTSDKCRHCGKVIEELVAKELRDYFDKIVDLEVASRNLRERMSKELVPKKPDVHNKHT